MEGVFGWTRIVKQNTHLLYTPCSSKTTKSATIYTWHGATWWVDLKTRWHLFPFHQKPKPPSQINKRLFTETWRVEKIEAVSRRKSKQLLIQPLPSARVASRRSTLKNFWKAPCASMAQPSTLAFVVGQVVVRRRWWLVVGRFFLGWQLVRSCCFLLGGNPGGDRNVRS